MAATVAAGFFVGVAGALLQAAEIARFGVQSLAVGAVLAVTLIGVAATIGLPRPRWRAALLASLVAVVTQHAWLYRTAMARRRDAIANQPAVEFFRPGWAEQTFVEYMQSAATTQTVALWALDACLLSAAAVVIVELSSRQRATSGE